MPSKSKAQSELMRAACHDADIAKKKKIKQEIACHWVAEDMKKAAKNSEFAKEMGINQDSAKQWVKDNPTQSVSLTSKNW